MDAATRQLLELRRDLLIAEVRRLNDEELARGELLVSSPSFDPFDGRVDAKMALLHDQQENLISQIVEIERQLGG